MAEGGLGEDRHVVAQVGEGVHVVWVLDAVDRVGGHGDRALGLLVAGVAHVDDLVALVGAGLHLVVDLGHQWTDGVDRVATHLTGPPNHLGRRAMSGEHQGCAVGDVVYVVYEDHALGLEAFHNQPVVDDLVVAVDGFVERPDQPGEGLDGHLHAGAETAWFGHQHPVDPPGDPGGRGGGWHARTLPGASF